LTTILFAFDFARESDTEQGIKDQENAYE